VLGLPSWANVMSLRLTCNCPANRFSMPKNEESQATSVFVADHLLLVRDKKKRSRSTSEVVGLNA